MTKSLGGHGAKAHLSLLLDDVAAGEKVVLTERRDCPGHAAHP